MRETLAQLWWFWRDRKTLINNLLTPMVQAITAYGAVTFAVSSALHQTWALAGVFSPAFNWALVLNSLIYLAIRTGCSGRVYGWKFAAATPLRIVWGSWINFMASAAAVQRYATARITRRRLVWLKTEHAYPNRTTLVQSVETVPMPEEETVSIPVTRALPAELSRRWKVLPFKVSAGHLHLAGVERPTEEMHLELAGLSSLEIRFHRISEEDFLEMSEKYLPPLRGCLGGTTTSGVPST